MDHTVALHHERSNRWQSKQNRPCRSACSETATRTASPAGSTSDQPDPAAATRVLLAALRLGADQSGCRPTQPGSYIVRARCDGHRVAGVGSRPTAPTGAGVEHLHQRQSADKTRPSRAKTAGGTILSEPFDVDEGPAGWRSLADPQGAVVQRLGARRAQGRGAGERVTARGSSATSTTTRHGGRRDVLRRRVRLGGRLRAGRLDVLHASRATAITLEQMRPGLTKKRAGRAGRARRVRGRDRIG